MSKFFEELKRRNVIKASIAYVVVAWVILQVLSIVLPTVGAPEWVMKTLMILMVIGFPIWIFFSWVYEVTPEGLKKTEQNTEERGISETTNKRLNILILVGLVAAIAVALLRPNTGINYSSSNNEYAIAVLPFDDMSAQKDTEWFCDGVTEDILTHLSKISGLKVISRTSTERYKSTDKSVPEIAAELGVSYVVEGSVRKHNDDVLITAQLINASDEHLWADNFNEKMTDVFKIQSEVSKKIVEQLKIKISPEEEKELSEFPTNSIEAYQAYLQGRSYMEKLNEKDGEIAIDFFKKATGLDPNYADAYAEMGFVQMTTFFDTIASNTNINKALELSPNSSRANSYKGIYLNFMMRKPDEAITYLEKAISLNPNDAKAHDMMAAYYVNLNEFNKGFKPDFQKALHHVNKAVELDPFYNQSQYLKINILIQSKKFDDAETLFKEKMDLFVEDNNKNMAWRIMNGKINESIGNGEPLEKEIEILNKALTDYPFNGPFITRRLGMAYDRIYNDDVSYLNYAKKAFEMDSTSAFNNEEYLFALVENGLFDETSTLLNSENFKSVLPPSRNLITHYYFNYVKGDLEKSMEIIEDSLMRKNDLSKFTRKAFVYAKMGDVKNTYRLLESGKVSNSNKALVFAMLKERDSLYFYLNKLTPAQALFPNCRPELDPYRKETKYIEFLKKNKFPIDQQKN